MRAKSTVPLIAFPSNICVSASVCAKWNKNALILNSDTDVYSFFGGSKKHDKKFKPIWNTQQKRDWLQMRFYQR